MTRVVFFRDKERIVGFDIVGHCTSNYKDEVGKLCCAAVSSAAYMTANTITDIEHCKADIVLDDGEMRLRLTGNETIGCEAALKGLNFTSRNFQNNTTDI